MNDGMVLLAVLILSISIIAEVRGYLYRKEIALLRQELDNVKNTTWEKSNNHTPLNKRQTRTMHGD